MDKGIRPACNAKFLSLLPTRVNTREGNTAFRKNVIAFVMEDYGTTLASAATHYNCAFVEARKAAETDATLLALLEGLGRAEDKKGGRKPKSTAATPSVIPSPVNNILQGFINAGIVPGQRPAAVISDAAAAVGLEALLQDNVQGDAAEEAAPADVQVQLFSVYKTVKGDLVAEGLTREAADALIAKAAAAKKSKLEARAQ